MADLLVRLYDLPEPATDARHAAEGIAIRRALAPEGHIVIDWVRAQFGEMWASEAGAGLSRLPVTTFVAVRGNEVLGFACYDTSARGFFGPTGVHPQARGRGLGEALLMATLRAMREAGYGYAVIGDPGPVEFYRRRLDAMEIPGSAPGIYRGMLRRDPAP